MKLLFITTDFPPAVGGIQTYSMELVGQLAARCEKVVVLAPGAPDDPPPEGLNTLKVVRVRGGSRLFPVIALFQLASLLREAAFDAVLCTSWPAVAPVLLAGHFRSSLPPIFCAAHGRELRFNPYRRLPFVRTIYERIRIRVLAGVEKFFPVSSFTAALLSEFGIEDERMSVVRNGVDARQFRPALPPMKMGPDPVQAETEGPVLLTVGRLVRRKGVATMFRALPSLITRHPGLRYVIVGSGPDRRRLLQLSARLNLNEVVHFVGGATTDELVSWYNRCDVFILPVIELEADVEGCGLVALEAGACAKPVVCTRAGGIPEYVVDRETGILVKPGSPLALARAVDALLSQPAAARHMGLTARRHALDAWNWSEAANRLIGDIRRTCSGRPKPVGYFPAEHSDALRSASPDRLELVQPTR